MATALRFAQNIRSRASNVQNNSVKIVKRVAKKALRSLVYATPVDKGVARSNWRVSLGNVTRSTIPAYAPGHHLGITETQNAEMTIAVGNAAIDRLSYGISIYIGNNTPYIELLNKGSSNQSPGNFIERAEIIARKEIANFKLLER